MPTFAPIDVCAEIQATLKASFCQTDGRAQGWLVKQKKKKALNRRYYEERYFVLDGKSLKCFKVTTFGSIVASRGIHTSLAEPAGVCPWKRQKESGSQHGDGYHYSG
jgi:hypothetical protein